MQSSWRFWIVFILISLLFLGAWYFYWETRSGRGVGTLSTLSSLLPVSEELRGDLKTAVELAQAVIDTNGEERVFLVLFQNNMELRPGGGFIGAFGIVKIKDGTVTEFSSHDTGNFDGRIPDTVPAPYPMEETLRVKWLKLRDSNLSPDWPTNARMIEEFYRLGQGGETFDGVIGITTNVLTSFLEITGPVEVPGYPGTYGAENAILDLEYQVEKGFDEQGIERGERKEVMNLLGNTILEKVKALSWGDKLRLVQVVLDDLHKKDIMITLKDERLQSVVQKAGWGGDIDQNWRGDSLIAVDSNMGAFKTDYRMRRSLTYTVDLQGEQPQATVVMTYEHTGKARDYMTKDYQSFSRIYAPAGSWLEKVEGHAGKRLVFGEELGRKYFATMIHVPLGATRSVTWRYTLPAALSADYDLKIEKQPGVNDMPVTVTVIGKDGSQQTKKTVLNRAFVWSEAE